ncbi:MAG TPA: TonB-dependent receptor [Longimicrobiales bacterium]|nr:TonB-dependent receptor [Longimicrobiales bacterium]
MTYHTKMCGWQTVFAALLLVLLPAAALGQQTGRIAGTVSGSDGQPLVDVELTVVGTTLRAVSGAGGIYRIDNVPEGRQQVRATHFGFAQAVVRDVIVRAGAETRVDITAQPTAFTLGSVVVSASRGAQRVQDAPATITRIDAAQIENTVGNSFSGALKQVTGLDFIQVGVTAAAVNARGFNSSFNNRMLMIEDGRIAVLPENGLPVGTFTAVPKLDLAAVEVLVGPGAALYGADASNGVITLTTKDPRSYPGTQIEVAGGTRSYFDVQARHAGVAGRIGYKAAMEFQRADDFSNVLQYNIAGVGPTPETGIGGEVDWTSQVTRGSGGLFYYLDNSTFEFSGGMSVSDGVGQTNVGRNQLDGWQYNFAQLEWTHPNWYANAYRTQSKSGDSYALNRFTERKAITPSMDDEAARLASDWPSDGQLYAAEIQNNFRIPQLLNTRLVWGAQYRHDVVSSDRQWLTDRLTGEDLTIDQKGVYAQLEVPVHNMLDFVVAGRYDDHEAYDAQFSPKAAIVFKPTEDHSFRASYNRAFKSPTTLQTDFWIPDFTAVVGVYGNRHGLTSRDNNGAIVATYEGLVPEENQTVELGYKGVIARRLLLDVAVFRAEYKDFMSPLIVIANPYAATPTFAYDADGNQLTNDFGPPIALTYINMGKATLRGTDLGTRLMLGSRLDLTGTFSWADLSDVDPGPLPQGVEATALNAPAIKWTLGVDGREVLPRLGVGAVVRHVTGYRFHSGINQGKIPTFETLDLQASYRLPIQGMSVNLNVSNAFSCRTTYTDATLAGRDRSCGFDEKHAEMINMPEIGTMLFLGVRLSR